MANPTMLFENFFDDGTLTSSADASGFPKENITDWRIFTQWKANVLTAGEWLKADLGSGGDLEADLLIYAGHNLHTIGAKLQLEYSDNDSAWTNAITGSVPTTSAPVVAETSSPGAHRYWRASVNGGSPPYSTNAVLGVVILGRKLDFPLLPASLELDSKRPNTEWNINQNGSFVGANYRHAGNTLAFDFPAPGIATTDLWVPASGLGWDANAVTHIREKPWWFLYDTDTDLQDARLVHIDGGHSSPWFNTTSRRLLSFRAIELVNA